MNRSNAAVSVLTAGLLILRLTDPAAAASWDVSIPVAVQSDDTGEGSVGTPGGLITLGTSTAVAVYADQAGIWVIRSTDSGASWVDRLQLSTYGADEWADPHLGWMAIGGAESNVDVVWIEDWQSKDDAQIRYARSTDAGASYEPALDLASPAVGFPLDVSVARGPDDVVAVAWSKRHRGRHTVRVRVSRDGGAAFDPGVVVASGGVIRDAEVAVGKDVVYVTYVARGRDGYSELRLTRSLDGGGTWTNPVTIATNLAAPSYDWRRFPGPTSITAVGRRAYVGYTKLIDGIEHARYSRTGNAGATWSSAGLAARRSGSPVLWLQDGMVRAAYTRCFNRWCEQAGVFYRERSLTTDWTSPELIARGDVSPWPSGVGFASRPIVLWMLPPDGSGGADFGTYAAVPLP